MDLEASAIYEIRNRLNGKRYVGSAKCFRIRWNGHRALLRKGAHHSRHLQSAWNLAGEEAFQFSILKTCPPEALLVEEQAILDAEAPAYNVCPTAGNTLGRLHSPDTRAKIAARAVGRKPGPRTEEHRAKLSAVHKGKPKPAHVMEALQAGRKAQIMTDERRKRLSEAGRQSYESGRRTREKSEAHRHRIGRAFAKLTDDQIREIRELRASGVTGRALALQFCSNAGTISEICSGKRYAWVQ